MFYQVMHCRLRQAVISFLFVVLLSSCGAIQSKNPQATDSLNSIKTATSEPLTPEETGELLSEVGGNWLFGQGLGETVLAVGTIVAFPPSALWFVGNSALSLSGYKPLGVSTVLGEEHSETWNEAYDTVLSGPGRVVAGVAGEQYRSKEIIRENMQKYIDRPRRAEVAMNSMASEPKRGMP